MFLSSDGRLQTLHGKWWLISSTFAQSGFGALGTNTYYCKHMIKGPLPFVLWGVTLWRLWACAGWRMLVHLVVAHIKVVA